MVQPLALLDWDNTTVKNDIGNATFFWMVRNSKFGYRRTAAGRHKPISDGTAPQRWRRRAADLRSRPAAAHGTNAGLRDELTSGISRSPNTHGRSGVRQL